MFHFLFVSRFPAFARRFSRWSAGIGCGLALLSTSSLPGAQVNLRWADNATNESGFKVERATGSGSFAQIATTSANVVTLSDATAAANTTYRYRVRSYNSAGNSSYTNTASITTGSSSGNTAPTISSIASRTISRNGTTGAISFTIGDAQTAASSLTLIKNASNLTLVPLANITFGGSGANRTVTITPASNQTGSSTIWVKVSDGQLTAEVSFVLTVTSGTTGNTAPTISAISDRTIGMNGTTGTIAFTIGDGQTTAANLTLIKNASNLSLVPLANITFGGSGANRTVTVRPASNKTGWSTIWIKVSDSQLVSYVGFKLTVNSSGGNTAPTISSISDRTITINSSTGPIPFTIGDGQTATTSLTLIKNASNLGLVPLGNITFGGSGANRTVTVRPASNRTGWSTIWVKVGDGQLERYVAFTVSVQASLTYTTVSATGTEQPSTATSSMQSSATIAGDTADELRFGYVPLAGDTELTIQVTSLDGTDDETRAGLMFRESTSPDAACAGVYVTGSAQLQIVARTSAGATLQTQTVLAGSIPQWLRLTRSGDTFYAFASDDGATWELLEFGTVDLPDTALAGTAVTAPGGAGENTAQFTTLTVD